MLYIAVSGVKRYELLLLLTTGVRPEHMQELADPSSPKLPKYACCVLSRQMPAYLISSSVAFTTRNPTFSLP